MKHLLKNAAIFVALVLTVAFTGCKNPNFFFKSNHDGNPKSKLDAPTNLVVNSITDNTISCAVNITFNYNGKFEGATNAILGYSTTNDSSKAVYDTYNSTATVEAGENTRTVNYTGSYYFKPTSGKKYYFWLKVTSSVYNVSDSSWSNVAEFTCP